jgi:LmeA-like phospholipid-binding
MAIDPPNLGDKALSKVVEVGIAIGLDEAEVIDVDIRTNPGKLVQGKLDSVTISGKGLVIKQDLRMETIEVSIGKVGINPLSAVFGNIELIHPTDAEALIVLTQTDLNRAFRSDYIQAKLRGLKMLMNGQEVIVTVQQVSVNLPGDNKFVINIDFLLAGQSEIRKLSATAVPKIQEDGYRISLEILAIEGQGLNLDLVSIIVEQLTALLDMRNFNIPGLSLQLYQLEAPQGKLVIHSHAQVAQVTPIINLLE